MDTTAAHETRRRAGGKLFAKIAYKPTGRKVA